MARGTAVLYLVLGVFAGFLVAGVAGGLAVARMWPKAAAAQQEGEYPPHAVWSSGGVTVAVVQVRFGNVIVASSTRRTATPMAPESEYTVIGLRIYTSDPTKKLDVTGLSAAARAADDAGNVLKPVEFGRGYHAEGQIVGTRAAYPDVPLYDLLVFERPANAAKAITIEAPASLVGQPGTVRLRVSTRGMPAHGN